MISASTRFLAQPSEIKPTRNGRAMDFLFVTTQDYARRPAPSKGYLPAGRRTVHPDVDGKAGRNRTVGAAYSASLADGRGLIMPSPQWLQPEPVNTFGRAAGEPPFFRSHRGR